MKAEDGGRGREEVREVKKEKGRERGHFCNLLLTKLSLHKTKLT